MLILTISVNHEMVRKSIFKPLTFAYTCKGSYLLSLFLNTRIDETNPKIPLFSSWEPS